MNLDALAVRHLRDDLRAVLTDARVDKVLHPAENALALDIYGNEGRWQLVLSASPQAPAAFVTQDRLGRQDERTSPFLLLARKYLRGGRIRTVEQIDFDRVLVFDVEQWSDGAQVQSRLIAELTGRLANLVLTDDAGVIYDALRRVPGTINRVRTLMPKSRYLPPPATKPPIESFSPVELLQLDRTAAGQMAWRAAVDLAAGVSPLLAREAVFRVAGDPAATVPEASLAAVFKEIRRLVEVAARREEPVTGAWEGDHLIAFAPYELTHLPDVRPAPSLSSLIAVAYEQGAVPAGIESQRARLLERLDGMLGRERRIAADLEGAIERAADAERMRVEGELLLAFQHEVQPGQRELRVGDTTISLQPDESPLEQAQARFRQYRKLRSMAEGLPERLAAVRAHIELLETIRVHAETATSADDLRAIDAELSSAGRGAADVARGSTSKGKDRGRKSKRASPAAAVGQTTVDGWPVLYGRTAVQNARVTFDLASPDDLWLHARGVPGAHVVLRTGHRSPPGAVVERAASIAAALSSARLAAKVEVDVTEVRNVRKRPGAGPGMVIYRNERTITVPPIGPDLADGYES